MASDESELNIKEEYQLWRKNCKYMYEYVSETALTWPSLTVQWLPTCTVDEVVNAKLLLGTHTSGNDQEYLKLAATKLPKAEETAAQPEDVPKTKVSSIIKIAKKYEVESEINRARYMPQDADVVAALLNSGKVDLFNLSSGSKYSTFDTGMESSYCLSWNPQQQGHLLSSGPENKLSIRDINKESAVLGETSSHGDIVNDVSWHAFDANVFASATEDDKMMLFDARTPTQAVSSYHSVGSSGLNTLAFSPFSHNLVALGGSNSNINLVDLRTNKLLHTMMGHGDAITCMDFSPHLDGVLASGSQDRRVFIWDLSRIGEEQAQEDAEDGSPEIFMMHAGHTGAINDLSWCPFADWTLATVADDNIVHLWQVSKSLTEGELKVGEDVVLE